MKTNRTLKLITLTAAIFGFAATSFAQSTSSSSAEATIVTPITIGKDVDMNFGNIAVQASTGGTVVLSAAGARQATGGVTLPATVGTVAAAKFTVNGEPNYTYVLTLPASQINVTNGGSTMPVGTWTSSLNNNPGTLSASGTHSFTVGATLTVANGQAVGTYTNSAGFDVTANYN